MWCSAASSCGIWPWKLAWTWEVDKISALSSTCEHVDFVIRKAKAGVDWGNLLAALRCGLKHQEWGANMKLGAMVVAAIWYGVAVGFQSTNPSHQSPTKCGSMKDTTWIETAKTRISTNHCKKHLQGFHWPKWMIFLFKVYHTVSLISRLIAKYDQIHHFEL